MYVQYILVIFANHDMGLTDPFEERHKLSMNCLADWDVLVSL